MPECKAGTYSKNGLDQSKFTGDVVVSAGSSNVDHFDACKPCELGRYQPEAKQRECLACARGKNTLEEGAWKEEQCVDKCGDGMKTDAEGCDDGNTADGDGCSSLCVPEPGSKCSHKPYALSSCRPVVCGDGLWDSSDDGSKVEQCDDGNSEEGDGCDGKCDIEAGARCGDTKDGQKSKCAKVVCGDGKVESSHDQQVNEECDDGNTNDGDGCSSTCAIVGGVCVKLLEHQKPRTVCQHTPENETLKTRGFGGMPNPRVAGGVGSGDSGTHAAWVQGTAEPTLRACVRAQCTALAVSRVTKMAAASCLESSSYFKMRVVCPPAVERGRLYERAARPRVSRHGRAGGRQSVYAADAECVCGGRQSVVYGRQSVVYGRQSIVWRRRIVRRPCTPPAGCGTCAVGCRRGAAA